ncbi:hypothetical protein [Parvibaculum sp.]|uniref:hypothetical protein n=1 Tax=Parvibaculum sp. TaxID=2024848 RepID=UPI001DD4BB7C|nr:hypothetical protein [Parvibaculum sp.]MBX3487854.1 hypothetical protein [Parvibaculum sp.]
MARRSGQFRDVIITGIPAGEERSFNDAGTIVSCLSADAPFQLAFDDGNFFYVAPGLGYRPFDAAGQVLEFSSLIIRNVSASPLDVHLQIGTGDIIDNRAVYGGTAVPIQPIDFNGPQPIQPITFAAAQPISISNALMPPSPRRTDDGGSIPSVGVSHALLTTGDTDFVAAAANVNGVILRRGMIGGSGGTDQVHLIAGQRRILSCFGPGTKHIGELYIRPGLRLRGEIPTTGRVEVSFDIL